MSELPRYVSARKIREHYLDIGERTLWRWIADPSKAFPKPAISMGGKTRLWKRADVEKWLEQHEAA